MAAQEHEVASDLASQATAPSHALDSESLLSQPSVIVEAEPEAEPDEADDVFGDAEPSDAPYEVPTFQVKTEPVKDADKKKWKSYNAQRKKEKKDLIPFEVWLANKKDQEERKKKAKFVAMICVEINQCFGCTDNSSLSHSSPTMRSRELNRVV